MHNLEMNDNEIQTQITPNRTFQIGAKFVSRRLFIKISLSSLALFSSIDNLPATKNELNKDMAPKKNLFPPREPPRGNTNTSGSEDTSSKGNGSSQGSTTPKDPPGKGSGSKKP